MQIKENSTAVESYALNSWEWEMKLRILSLYTPSSGLFEFVKKRTISFLILKKGHIGNKGRRQPPSLLHPFLQQPLVHSPAAIDPTPSHSSSCSAISFLPVTDFSTEWPSLSASVSTAILFIVKKHHMFLFDDCQPSKNGK